MAKIKVLSMQVANLIAAGEVVDRPASVVKELLENAIDAGATQVTVEVAGGGVTLVRVSDNGSGMSREDAEACFGRHATSKIREADDLAGIATLGFRGEALAAIAAVSRVTMQTREADSDEGVEVVVEGGRQLSCEPCGCPVGTSVTVQDLFFNTPARRKFLKKEATETATISGLVERLALSKPALSVTYRKDGRDSLRTDGRDSLSETVRAVLGGRLTSELLEVDYREGGVRVFGLVGTPEGSRPNRLMQNFFVAGRYVQSKVLQVALEEAYKGRLPVGRYPVCVLFVELHPTQVDANVHPQKLEVKFAHEQAVYDTLYNAVRGALDGRRGRPLIRAAQTGEAPAPPQQAPPAPQPPAEKSGAQAFDAAANRIALHASGPVLTTVRTDRPSIDVDPGEWQYYGDLAVGLRTGRPQGSVKTETPLEMPIKEHAPAPPQEEPDQWETLLPELAEQTEISLRSFRMVGELFRTYLVAEFEEEVWLVDKHAARERILYEQLKAQDSMEVQQLLSPQLIEPGRYVAGLAVLHREALARTGLELEAFGESALLLRTLPMGVEAERGGALLEELCTVLEEGRRDKRPAVLDEMLHRIACTAAVKGGDREPAEAGEALIEQLLALDNVQYCPHGRPCVKVVPKRSLEKEFLRA